jgi:hypothetical protein
LALVLGASAKAATGEINPTATAKRKRFMEPPNLGYPRILANL